MSTPVRYTPYHPKWYRRPVSVWWWLDDWRYTKFVLRELTSLPVAYVAALLLWQVSAIADGAQAYDRFWARMESPFFLVLNVLCLGAVLFHALTWFHLAPKAIVVRVAGKRVPDLLIVLMNYAGWVAASAVIAWFWLGG